MADVDVVVAGAGFAGIYAVYALREAGLTVRAFEAGDGIGGTWFWNSYPGARCDVESKDYSYSFSPELEQEWSWSERYPAQPEILRYLNHVADRFDLWPHIQLNTRVTAATWNDGDRCRTVASVDAGRRSVTARFFVSAVGVPVAVPGALRCRVSTCSAGPGTTRRAGRSEGVDFTGKRVGLVGTGSTGIQVAPEIAAAADHLYVFQRTANFAVPNRNRPWEAAEWQAFKSRYRDYRAEARESFLGVPCHRDGAAGAFRAGPRTCGGCSLSAGRQAAACRSSAPTPTCLSRRRPTTSWPSSCGTGSGRPWPTRRSPSCSARAATRSARSGCARATTTTPCSTPAT